MRLNRFIARAGISSRRKAEDLIRAGKIKINEKIVTELSTIVNPRKDTVTVDGNKIEIHEKVYLALNKPPGYLSTKKDPHGGKTIYDILPPDASLFSVGRLDKETRGVILITNDGEFAQNIIHPSKKIEKKYLVQTTYAVTPAQLKSLQEGVVLPDGKAKAEKACKTGPNSLDITIVMGKNRIVRRMLRAAGNEVRDLERVSIGNIKAEVPEGSYRTLREEEVSEYV